MWVPLHLHSQYSILDATPSVEKIAKRAAICGMPAVALTDHGNMHGAIDFYKACQEQGVCPIIGCELYVAPNSRFDKKKELHKSKTAHHLILLAKNEEGYHNLARLSSLGYLEGFYYNPRVDKELLQKYHAGLVCLSACLSGQVASAALYGTKEEFLEEIKWHHDLFGEDYYLELQRHTMKPQDAMLFQEPHLRLQYDDFIAKQTKVNEMLVEASKSTGIKLVATNDTHYLDQEEWQAHEILLNIQSGEPVEIWEKDARGNNTFRVPNPKRRSYASRELYFKTPAEMMEIFKDIPEAISNTLEVASKCKLKLDLKAKHYPLFIPPKLAGTKFTKEEQSQSVEQFLRALCVEGIPKRYTQEALAKVGEKYPGKDPMEVVQKRLEYELEIITSKEMCDYLLIVWDFIDWAKRRGIPMGPGRGSGAGSIILYLIGITDIEPLRFDLFFERFINPERISYPDIDVDICMARRQEVIDYTLNKYGKENIAQIITFGTMKAKMTIKDVGRVLSVPLSKVNQIAKLVPEDLNMTLSKALEVDLDLHNMYMNDEDAKKIIDLGKKLEGSIRNTGIHAAGIIISADKLMNHIPVCLAKDSEMIATQYSMKPVEAVGMLKIDFLGLKTLTSIALAVSFIKENHQVSIDWVNLGLEDKKTFSLLQQGRTLGVFQMESQGMQELSRQLQPDRFEEIIAIGALYRPGPMDMIPSFISRKHGKEAIEYDHPLMKTILSETYGIMVYQEQVMQIATQLAKYSLGEGDVLRRAMGKKDAAQMAKEREKFKNGAVENGIQENVATAIFDKMEKFASYGFNKSHAAAYGYLTYVTAYLKANYPNEWMAALMTCDRDDLTKVAKFIREAHVMGIAILPPDVNEAGKEFIATPQGIRFAMTGIKGIGEGIVELILKERKQRGPFTSFYDFFKRVDLKKIGKKTIEHLVEAGCFDFTGWPRSSMVLMCEEIYDFCVKNQEDTNRGVLTFFSLIGDEGEKKFLTPPPPIASEDRLSILKREKELLGFFLTGHPLDNYRSHLSKLSCVPLSEVENMEHQAVLRAAFIIEGLEVRIAQKTQRKFAILTISDGIESYELPIWSELFEAKSTLLQENQLIYAVLSVDKREETTKLNCSWFEDLTQANEGMIAACDFAYDRAKFKNTRFNHAKSSDSKPKKEAKVNTAPFTIKLEMDKIRFSHILRIKSLLQMSAGPREVRLEFCRGALLHSTLTLDPTVGVETTQELISQLHAIQGITCIAN
jgi:DNA polymerase-3 subunit alpha